MATQHRRKKTTFALDKTILKDAKEIALEAEYPSLNDFVEAAIGEMIKRHRKKAIKHQLLAASRDPLFLDDIEKSQCDFQDTDCESLEKHP